MGKLSPQEYKSMKEMFNLYDKDHNGKISETELRKLLSLTGENPTTAEVSEIIGKYGCKGDITLKQFAEMWADVSSRQTNTREVLRKSFKVFDRDGDNKINEKELRKIMTSLGEKLTDAEVTEMFSMADANSDGKIEINEFINFFQNPISPHKQGTTSRKKKILT